MLEHENQRPKIQDSTDKPSMIFHGLVRRIRYAFELLRPEEMTILRQWARKAMLLTTGRFWDHALG